ncbi:PAC2 family protein [Corynebacterium heidelbergense]|uniref:Proteasome protein n=1 Tax=Corynebacterium heidelbergense TaxID=2055947 RepID=A0A364V653_9CORY|nr:PAC2 family protein [Corynebacterium heidelbergense]RAV32101.1 proteasome protein [Corynebacterium heidelbergense]
MTDNTPANNQARNRMYEMEYPAPIDTSGDHFRLPRLPERRITPEGHGAADEEGTAEGLPMLIALHGYADAGQAVAHSGTHLLQALPHSRVARFNVDELVDYRSRRPGVTIEGNRIADTDRLELDLHAVDDADGHKFLLLSGPEPDLRWEAFSEAVADLARRVRASKVVTLYAAPMAVPHTRPIAISAHASDPELARDFHSWDARITVPGAAALEVERRLSAQGCATIGLTAHVPHYVSAHDYPEATYELLKAVSGITGRVFPLKALEAEMNRVQHQLAEQVEESEEIASVVHALERQYDAHAEKTRQRRNNSLLAPGQSIPTSDELGAEFEAFLAEMSHGADGAADGPSAEANGDTEWRGDTGERSDDDRTKDERDEDERGCP